MRMPNFHYPDFFISKFGREPKAWTITQVHDLWIETKKRNSLRYKSISDHLKYGVFEILSSMIHKSVFSKMHLRPHYTRMDFKKVIRISGRNYLFDATSDRAKMEEIKESEIVQLD